jgi:hypothetical protein
VEERIMSEQIQELTRQVTILNERLPNHIDWSTRNLLDHEKRIRLLEQFRWMVLGISLASGAVGAGLSKILGA